MFSLVGNFRRRYKCLGTCVTFVASGRECIRSNLDQLPLDIDEAETNVEVYRARAEAESQPGSYPQKNTSLSMFLRIVKLRMIDSEIQQTIYRVDKHSDYTAADVDRFISQLAEWHSTIPRSVNSDGNSHVNDSPDFHVSHSPLNSTSFLLFLQTNQTIRQFSITDRCDFYSIPS